MEMGAATKEDSDGSDPDVDAAVEIAEDISPVSTGENEEAQSIAKQFVEAKEAETKRKKAATLQEKKSKGRRKRPLQRPLQRPMQRPLQRVQRRLTRQRRPLKLQRVEKKPKPSQHK